MKDANSSPRRMLHHRTWRSAWWSYLMLLLVSMDTINCLVTNILQNILVCAQQKKETHTGLMRFAERMWIPMLGFTCLPHVGGIFGGLITRKEVKTWYITLNKPSWRPPNAAFPVVWTTLYTGMGYGSYLVWKELGGFTQDAMVPLGLYGLQLALNWAWTPIFFGAHKIKLAMIEIVLLSGTVAATMVSWYPISRTATLLMAPYMAWLCLATCLNYCIWRDNPDPKKDD